MDYLVRHFQEPDFVSRIMISSSVFSYGRGGEIVRHFAAHGVGCQPEESGMYLKWELVMNGCARY